MTYNDFASEIRASLKIALLLHLLNRVFAQNLNFQKTLFRLTSTMEQTDGRTSNTVQWENRIINGHRRTVNIHGATCRHCNQSPQSLQ